MPWGLDELQVLLVRHLLCPGLANSARLRHYGAMNGAAPLISAAAHPTPRRRTTAYRLNSG